VPPDGRSVNESGLDLVKQVSAMNGGVYLEELLESTPTDFCIGVAAYPEKHVEAPNLEWDVQVLLDKQRAGADYAVTQIFYERVYFRFCGVPAGVDPIIPGLKIVTRASQLRLIPKTFGATVPERLVEEVVATPEDRVVDVGIRWALDQTRELLDRGVPSVHFYIMANTAPLVALMEQLRREA
jgi:methylenetetrahydrofolate reductase (NADPH)